MRQWRSLLSLASKTKEVSCHIIIADSDGDARLMITPRRRAALSEKTFYIYYFIFRRFLLSVQAMPAFCILPLHLLHYADCLLSAME